MSRWTPVALLLGWCLGVSVAWADPPGRVGRLAEATGPVWLFDQHKGEWTAAPLNRPITEGDRLHTDPSARADIRIGSTSLRLDGNTEVEFKALDDDRIRVLVQEGSVGLRLRAADKVREIELLTPEGRMLPQRVGRYRVDRQNAATAVTVADGTALFEGQGAAVTLYPRQRGEFWLDSRLAGPMQYSITDPLRDAFSSWNNGRDQVEDRAMAGNRYVSPEMTGADDLERHGEWIDTPEHGPVWTPRSVPPGWAPYRFGSWAWIGPWGWTWVDDAPWGFAPFHYGRWVWHRSAWCWSPGRWVARPVYAPALVAWVGGPGVSVGVSVGGPPVGWFPLAPREVYVPWYGVSPRYVQNINYTHVTSITNVTQIIQSPNTVVAQTPYTFRHFEPGVTVVPGSVLTGRRPVAPIAAQWRDLPGVRDLIRDPGRGGPVLSEPGVPGLLPRVPGYVAGRPPPVRAEVPAGPPARMNIPERNLAPIGRPSPTNPPVEVGSPGFPVAPGFRPNDPGRPPAASLPIDRGFAPPPQARVPLGTPATPLPGTPVFPRAEPRPPVPDVAAEQGAAGRIGRETPPPVGRPPAWAGSSDPGFRPGFERGRDGGGPLLSPGRPSPVPDARVMAPPPPMPMPPPAPARVEPPPRMAPPHRLRPDDPAQGQPPSPLLRPQDRRDQAR
jgi:hypothetical protein